MRFWADAPPAPERHCTCAVRQNGPMSGGWLKAINDLDEDAFQSLHGRWEPLEPGQVAEMFSGSSVRWWIAGGRAARAGAPPRWHADTDVAFRLDDLDELRACRGS